MLKKIQKANLKNKRVFIRCDFNVPISKGKILDDFKIRQSIHTIIYALDKGASQIILATHLGRPTKKDKHLSTKPIAKILKKYLKEKVTFCDSFNVPKDKIVLLENLRFDEAEKRGCKRFAKKLSKLADVYVNNAFGVSHRKDTSIFYLPKLVPSYAGLLVQEELKKVSLKGKKIIAIFGAAKINDKLPLLKELLKKVDKVIITGAAEFTFFKALKIPVGKSLVEKDMVKEAAKLYKKYSSKIIFPSDFNGKKYKNIPFDEIPKDMVCLDVGKKSLILFKQVLKDAKTIIWNGPLGKFEETPFDKGTLKLGKFISSLDVNTLILGGDTVSSLKKIKLGLKTHISTGGGASLQYLIGKKLPGIEVLN